jgi:hypothetical protein
VNSNGIRSSGQRILKAINARILRDPSILRGCKEVMWLQIASTPDILKIFENNDWFQNVSPHKLRQFLEDMERCPSPPQITIILSDKEQRGAS